ncbi:hypothetical protein [Sandarakinorhabdus sp.]|uniref:hypothetical protein n=1 Tax=Sandarakinorhabdus sp. TaxID=1916663 RepID=UPI003F6F56E9
MFEIVGNGPSLQLNPELPQLRLDQDQAHHGKSFWCRRAGVHGRPCNKGCKNKGAGAAIAAPAPFCPKLKL